MANSLRAKLSKLRHDGNITDAEYQKLIAKLDGHDKENRNKVIDELVERIKIHVRVVGTTYLEDIDEIAEQLKEE